MTNASKFGGGKRGQKGRGVECLQWREVGCIAGEWDDVVESWGMRGREQELWLGWL